MRDECYFIIHESRVSYCFYFERTYKFEIKSCVEYFVVCVLIYFFLIHNTNAGFIEHDNDVIMMRKVTVSQRILNI